MKKGLVQIYTGNGKGKTTAALGLALRAAGAGFKVYIGQFIKSKAYSETKALKKIKNIKIEQYGRGCFIKGKPKKIDIECARKGLRKAQKNIMSGKYDMIILDEVIITLKLRMIKTEDIINIIKGKPRSAELVLTGRYCPRGLLKHADLITKMKEIRHPYRKGIKARLGIEY
ncbi:MAG: cob(I)yrinic acid a,c-diamide adenosyltransferase [Candidatus Omnitrophota bacterium]|nr:MAG: cob(I)yrinic acid a,c-diamide adenosyltransferase [Candidatus Omnitrophota bacterium]